MKVKSLQQLLSVSVGPAACRCGREWLSRVQRRAVVDESRASLAWEVVVVLPVLHSSPYCIP